MSESAPERALNDRACCSAPLRVIRKGWDGYNRGLGWLVARAAAGAGWIGDSTARRPVLWLLVSLTIAFACCSGWARWVLAHAMADSGRTPCPAAWKLPSEHAMKRSPCAPTAAPLAQPAPCVRSPAPAHTARVLVRLSCCTTRPSECWQPHLHRHRGPAPPQVPAGERPRGPV